MGICYTKVEEPKPNASYCQVCKKYTFNFNSLEEDICYFGSAITIYYRCYNCMCLKRLIKVKEQYESFTIIHLPPKN
jgi:C4-type Zn-finger protein